ncbi:MAG: transcriptional regulator GcvA [Rhizobiales bacterium]|nr:transcriptional regulator GcvA [Hyphomicrobiales bacterium]MBI3672489.1 transcriptional regulator GcvA [Hyphomicrobiales bacterium]
MARRLPSLNALKAFEAAARHGSFSEAAAELFVSHAAVSRHIRDLEEWLGTKLFRRTGRGVEATDAGRRFGAKLTPLFDTLAEATREAAAVGDVRQLKVSVEPAFASRWLVARLGRFHDLHPDIELAIDPTNQLVDFRAGVADLGIRYGAGPWEDVEAVKLSDVVIFPVGAPAVVPDGAPLKPEDLKDHNLLHEQRKQWWADWLAAAGVTGVEDWRGTLFHNHLAIEAAEAGQGFALGDQILCTDSLLEGWLRRPFNRDMKDHGSYWIVRAKGSKESAPARSFREWLMAEMAETNRKFASLKAQQGKSASR